MLYFKGLCYCSKNVMLNISLLAHLLAASPNVESVTLRQIFKVSLICSSPPPPPDIIQRWVINALIFYGNI